MKRLCAGLLVLLFLVPVVSAHDDEISVRDLFYNSNDNDDAIAAVSDASAVDYSCIPDIDLKHLCDFTLAESYAFELSLSFDLLIPPDAPVFCERYITLPDGRAPPVRAVSI